MELLKQKILTCGKIVDGDVLKVDDFLNHKIDVPLMNEVAKEFAECFKAFGVTKVLTIEASGIAIAVLVALQLGVPAVYAKKHEARNLSQNIYQAEVYSFTKSQTYSIRVDANYITADDNVLIVDDFLANGSALSGLIDIVKQSKAKLAGCGIVIEKAFLPGGDIIREQDILVKSLARIESISEDGVTFCC